MKLTDLTSLALIETNIKGNTKEDVMDELIQKFDENGIIKSARKFKKAIVKREKESTTGIGFHIAIPHGKSSAVLKPQVAFGMKKDGVNWESLDGEDAKLIFMIAVPEESNNEHLKILQMLSRKLMDDNFRDQLLQANTNEEIYALLEEIQ